MQATGFDPARERPADEASAAFASEVTSDLFREQRNALEVCLVMPSPSLPKIAAGSRVPSRLLPRDPSKSELRKSRSHAF
jgi:hypothetical protein